VDEGDPHRGGRLPLDTLPRCTARRRSSRSG
jgi:hypothetical protein